jgi:hypothetical protein
MPILRALDLSIVVEDIMNENVEITISSNNTETEIEDASE